MPVGSVSLPRTSYSSTSGNDRTFTKLFDYDDYTYGNHTETFTATVTGTGNTATDSVTLYQRKMTKFQLLVLLGWWYFSCLIIW